MTKRASSTGPRAAHVGLLVSASLLLAVASSSQPVDEIPTLDVGIVLDGPQSGPIDLDVYRSEILALTRGEFDVRFPAEATLVGDWTSEAAAASLDTLLADPEIDLVLALGVLGSNALCCREALPKPAVAGFVVDNALQDFPFAGPGSGAENLTYVSLPDPIAQDLETFREIVPFEQVVILVHGALLRAIPDLAARTERSVRALGLDFSYVAVEDSARGALDALPADAEAVYITPLSHLPDDEQQALIDGLIERRLPSFSLWDAGDVERGVLAGRRYRGLEQRIARRVALVVQRILLGEPPGTIPVAFEFRDRLRLNVATAREIGVSPRWEVLIEAELVGADELEGVPALTLRDAVAEAIELNLDVVARERAVAAAERDVALARSAFLPQLGAGLTALEIDEDRAAASFGSQSERELFGSLTLDQLVYSDGALGNVAIERQLQRGRELAFDALRLDVALAAATIYLNTLRAAALVEVQQNNLQLTRDNLELAQLRRRIGAANPAEVYRWQSQIALDRKALIEARADRTVAEIALRRLLHRDLGAPVRTLEIGDGDPELVADQGRFAHYSSTPRHYDAFMEFIVARGLDSSPELARLDALIAAQERLVGVRRRAFWAPTLGLQASLEEILARGGIGSDRGDSPLPLFPAVDDTSWSLALFARLPLFEGGARTAERSQAELELEQLELEREAVAERIEQGIRSAAIQTRSSLSGIELAREAARAARQNLELVADAYVRGAVSIIDLLDAQNAALNADLLAANAGYDFWIDLMSVLRAANQIDAFLDPTRRRTLFEGLRRYFTERGLEPEGSLP